MARRIGRRGYYFIAALVLTVLVSVGVWAVAFDNALARLKERTDADLAVTADRLTNQLQRFGEHAVLLSGHADLAALIQDPSDDTQANIATAILLDAADKTRAQNIALYDVKGQVVAAAHALTAEEVQIAGRAEFERAMDGALGLAHSFDDARNLRISSYAHPVFGPGGPIIGVVVLRIDVERIEADWRADPTPVFFSTLSGRVLVSNRSEFFDVATDQTDISQDVMVRAWRAIGGYDIWALDAGRYLPSQALHVGKPLPLIDLTGDALADIAPVVRLAWLQSLAVGGLLSTFLAFVFMASERRRALSERLSAEAALNEALEQKVRARTQELSDANVSLRREIAERKEAETALRAAQDSLVQAGKLSALGKMSAGISHELNQPLMAIQSFAENGKLLMKREDKEAVTSNLGHISDLAHRMGRIIKNLRAFARQENIPIGDVNLASVVETTLELVQPRAVRDTIAIRWTPPDEALIVRAGEVRLQQVILNLVSNAMDAVAGAETQEITIWTSAGNGENVMLHVADSGPGINEPEKIFDPFYSTKEVGHADGMGLGLSISYGIAQSFGGGIQGRNRDEGGAEFTVELVRSALDQVA